MSRELPGPLVTEHAFEGTPFDGPGAVCFHLMGTIAGRNYRCDRPREEHAQGSDSLPTEPEKP